MKQKKSGFALAKSIQTILPLHRFRKEALAEQPADADVAQLVERNLAKVEVAGSNLVIRSNTTIPESFIWLGDSYFY